MALCTLLAGQSSCDGKKDIAHRDPRLTSSEYWDAIHYLDAVTLTRADGYVVKLKNLATGPRPMSTCAGSSPPVASKEFNVRVGTIGRGLRLCVLVRSLVELSGKGASVSCLRKSLHRAPNWFRCWCLQPLSGPEYAAHLKALLHAEKVEATRVAASPTTAKYVRPSSAPRVRSALHLRPVLEVLDKDPTAKSYFVDVICAFTDDDSVARAQRARSPESRKAAAAAASVTLFVQWHKEPVRAAGSPSDIPFRVSHLTNQYSIIALSGPGITCGLSLVRPVFALPQMGSLAPLYPDAGFVLTQFLAPQGKSLLGANVNVRLRYFVLAYEPFLRS